MRRQGHQDVERNAVYVGCRSLLAMATSMLTRARHFDVPDLGSMGGVLIASNHQSYLDPGLVAMAFRRPFHFLARAELFRVPGFGRLISMAHAHPVKQDQVDVSAVKTMIRVLRGGGALLVFPEGTRTFDGSLGEFKSGIGAIALRCKVPVLPTCIEGAFDCWPRTRVLPRPGRIAVAFGDLVEPQGKSASMLTEAVRSSIARMQTALRRYLDGEAGTRALWADSSVHTGSRRTVGTSEGGENSDCQAPGRHGR